MKPWAPISLVNNSASCVHSSTTLLPAHHPISISWIKGTCGRNKYISKFIISLIKFNKVYIVEKSHRHKKSKFFLWLSLQNQPPCWLQGLIVSVHQA